MRVHGRRAAGKMLGHVQAQLCVDDRVRRGDRAHIESEHITTLEITVMALPQPPVAAPAGVHINVLRREVAVAATGSKRNRRRVDDHRPRARRGPEPVRIHNQLHLVRAHPSVREGVRHVQRLATPRVRHDRRQPAELRPTVAVDKLDRPFTQPRGQAGADRHRVHENRLRGGIPQHKLLLHPVGRSRHPNVHRRQRIREGRLRPLHHRPTASPLQPERHPMTPERNAHRRPLEILGKPQPVTVRTILPLGRVVRSHRKCVIDRPPISRVAPVMNRRRGDDHPLPTVSLPVNPREPCPLLPDLSDNVGAGPTRELVATLRIAGGTGRCWKTDRCYGDDGERQQRGSHTATGRRSTASPPE